MTLFDTFWKAYPKRNNKKVGRYPCQLWFKAYVPDKDIVDKMVSWLKIDVTNRKAVQGKGEFYAEACDPLKFLKDRKWMDDIGVMVTKESRTRRDRTEMVRKQELNGYKDKYTVWLMAKTPSVIKDKQSAMSREFMLLANKYPEVREWALTIRPDLKSNTRIV